MPICTPTEGLMWLGETKGFWIQTGAFLVSAIAAIGVIIHSGRQSRRRATIDLTLHDNQNTALKEAKDVVAHLIHENNGRLTQLACDDLSKDPNNIHLLLMLNNYEFIASGIKEGALDEEMYKRMRRSIVIRDWQAFSGYVLELRNKKNNPKVYAEFEWLAERWRSSEIKDGLSFWRRCAKKIGM